MRVGGLSYESRTLFGTYQGDFSVADRMRIFEGKDPWQPIKVVWTGLMKTDRCNFWQYRGNSIIFPLHLLQDVCIYQHIIY